MAFITPAKPIVKFLLRTTKPFHNKKAAKDFFNLVDSYGYYYRPVKYGNYEPLKQIYDENKKDDLFRAWFYGQDLSEEQLESQYHEGSLAIKGKNPSKIEYSINWANWSRDVLFNHISVIISKPFLQKRPEYMQQFINFCNDLVHLFPPVHAEIYDYTSSLPCTCTESSFIPDFLSGSIPSTCTVRSFIPDILSERCPALKWRTYFGQPYIDLLGRDTILHAPCFRTEEVGDTIVLQLTETVFEDIPQTLRQEVVDYFESSVDPELRAELGTDFIFRPFYASQSYSKEKKLVPDFPIQEFFGKKLDMEKIAKETLI